MLCTQEVYRLSTLGALSLQPPYILWTSHPLANCKALTHITGAHTQSRNWEEVALPFRQAWQSRVPGIDHGPTHHHYRGFLDLSCIIDLTKTPCRLLLSMKVSLGTRMLKT